MAEYRFLTTFVVEVQALVESVGGRSLAYRTGVSEERGLHQRAAVKVVEKATTLTTAVMARDSG